MLTPTLTNTELLEELEASYLEERQKKALEPLIATMSEPEKTELHSIIEEAKKHAEDIKKGPEYQAELQKLNEDYSKKLNVLTKESIKEARKTYETAEATENAVTLSSLEKSIEKMPTAARKTNKPKNSLWLIKILVILGVLTAAVWFGLKSLENL